MKTAREYKPNEIVKDWEENGIRCILKRGPSVNSEYFCAYLGISPNHLLAREDYDEMPISCHTGNFTYGKLGDGNILPVGWFFYGWDYKAHGDRFDLISFDGKDWTDEEVEEEMKSVLEDFKKLIRITEKVCLKLS